jgi:hypothetical protein
MAEIDRVDLPDDFDRLLRQELSIEPSPAFAARVRADASLPVRHRFPWTAWLLPLAGVAALALAVIVWRSPAGKTEQPVASAIPAPSVIATPTPSTLEPRPVTPLSAPVVNAARTLPGAARVSTASRRADPGAAVSTAAVVVDQSQRAALTALVGMIGQGRLTADAFAQTTPQSTRAIADEVVPIAVPPVTVSAIDPGGVLPNDTQRK